MKQKHLRSRLLVTTTPPIQIITSGVIHIFFHIPVCPYFDIFFHALLNIKRFGSTKTHVLDLDKSFILLRMHLYFCCFSELCLQGLVHIFSY